MTEVSEIVTMTNRRANPFRMNTDLVTIIISMLAMLRLIFSNAIPIESSIQQQQQRI